MEFDTNVLQERAGLALKSQRKPTVIG